MLVLSSPSGAGKTTLTRLLTRDDPDVELSVSWTTRPPREGEMDGVHYTFVSTDAFRAQRAADGFLEWAEVHDALTLALDALGEGPDDVDRGFLMNCVVNQRVAIKITHARMEKLGVKQ
jgi:ABC-type nitrate/sulfonate/bicarbonate transport system ATPase subunit